MRVIPPFIELGGRMWVVVNWAPDLPADAPLQLRPLNPQEIDWLEKALEDAYFDVFARFFPTDEEALNVSAGYLVDGLRYEPPKGMDELAAVWMVLSKAKQQALVQLASLLVPEKRAPRNRSSSAGKRRAKTSK